MVLGFSQLVVTQSWFNKLKPNLYIPKLKRVNLNDGTFGRGAVQSRNQIPRTYLIPGMAGGFLSG